MQEATNKMKKKKISATTEALPVSKKPVGKGGGARCPCFFFVALARENDSSHFSLFSSLPLCNAIFRFQALGINYFNNSFFLLCKASQFSNYKSPQRLQKLEVKILLLKNFKYRFQTQNLFA